MIVRAFVCARAVGANAVATNAALENKMDLLSRRASVDGVDADDVTDDVTDDEARVEFCTARSARSHPGTVASWARMASVAVRGGGEFVSYTVQCTSQ
jgi:hypothetical protein